MTRLLTCPALRALDQIGLAGFMLPQREIASLDHGPTRHGNPSLLQLQL